MNIKKLEMDFAKMRQSQVLKDESTVKSDWSIGEDLKYHALNNDKEKMFKLLMEELKDLIEASINIEYKYNAKFGDDRICECGHAYYRHFDSYDQMENIGCKYCECYDFKEKK